jgi:hypothetical protein
VALLRKKQGGKTMSLLKNRFGIPGVISVIALVFAMAGGAYAAKKYVITSTNQISPRVLKQLKGKPGADGKQGTAGANGKDASNGTNGQNGAAGGPGATGKSVTVNEIEAGEAECNERGGVIISVEGSGSGQEVCNGEAGSPWTAGGTLPEGATETGSWSMVGSATEEKAIAPISFAVPLAAAIPAGPSHVSVVGPGEAAPAACEVGGVKGTPANPLATSGHLCIYVTATEGSSILAEDFVKLPEEGLGFLLTRNSTNLGSTGASTAGTLLFIEAETKASEFAVGTWAVTG